MSKKPEEQVYHCPYCGQTVLVRQPAEHGVVCSAKDARRGSM